MNKSTLIAVSLINGFACLFNQQCFYHSESGFLNGLSFGLSILNGAACMVFGIWAAFQKESK